jgi:hypothetical protein
LLFLDLDEVAAGDDLVLHRGDLGTPLGHAGKQQPALLDAMLDAALVDGEMLARERRRRIAEIDLAPGDQSFHALLQQGEIVGAGAQAGQFGIGLNGVHAQQRLIRFDGIAFLDEDLVHDAAFQMLDRPHLRHRNELPMRQRQLADRHQAGPEQRRRDDDHKQAHMPAGRTEAALFLELDRRRQPIGVCGRGRALRWW